MAPDSNAPTSMIETAVEVLQDERTACVARLQKVISTAGHELEVQGYLRRIDNINAALVRLAGAHIVKNAH